MSNSVAAHLASVGTGKVVINGVDLSNDVEEFHVVARRGEATKVMLIVPGNVAVAGSVEVERVVDMPPHEVITKFLSAIDPETLDRDVLTHPNEEGLDTAGLFIDTLKRYASGP